MSVQDHSVSFHLPQSVGNVLQRENITTFDQFKAVAERTDQLPVIPLPVIEPKMALSVREEIARVAVLNVRPEKGRPHNPWEAAKFA
jgi:hypothetical protein